MSTFYIHDIPLPEAWARIEAALQAIGRWSILGVEEINLDEKAVGRILAEPVWAKISSPNYHASAMDGFAVRSIETAWAMPTRPVRLQIGMHAAYLDTGDPLPNWADAVIPIENIEPLDESGQITTQVRNPFAIRIRAAVTPWSHVRLMGEDIVTTQLVVPAGHILRPIDLGAIAACGHSKVKVARKPRVAIIPTGTELVAVGQIPERGEIIEYNSLVLAAQVDGWGGEADRLPIVQDEFSEIQQRVKDAACDYDLILLNAGSSAGSEDYSAQVIESLGQVLIHGVAVRPGHPVIVGIVQKEGEEDDPIPILGVPGYPVSAALTGEIFVEPLLARWLGRPKIEPETVIAEITHKVTSPGGDDDYLRVVVGKVGERMLATPLSRGAGVITSLVRADGITIVPRGSQGLAAGTKVPVRLMRRVADIDRTIFATGSHDILLDLLAQFLSTRERRLVSTNVGSLGGLVALRRNEAHLAGSHLLDPDSGEYNLPAIRQYLPGRRVRVVALVGRLQGFLVAPGNHKDIRSVEDLVKPDVSFVNRQRGAGTRVLLDYHLGLKGIATQSIRGYNQEEVTHLAVAAAIASGRADCGLGIAAAAQALGLDFIPQFQERYDLIIPMEYVDSHLLAPLFEVIQSKEFQLAAASLPGYDVSVMGTQIAEVG
jgi:putative molybdopterin biosynthesis protein